MMDAAAQQRVQALLDDLVGRNAERGLQVAAYLDGALVVDAWAGVADAATGRPVDGGTLFTVFSSSKGVSYTAIHLLAERGLLGYDDPVARWWPAFGAAGKAEITVWQVLTHTAGLPQMPVGIETVAPGDWDGICGALAAEAPLWAPGRAMGYHAFSQGYLLGEIVRRVASRPFAQVVADEISRPLGIETLFFGISDAVEARVATLEDDTSITNAPLPPPEALVRRAIPMTLRPLSDWANRPDVRRAVVPAGGGIMNARALARHYAALVGPVGGLRLLSSERVRLATAVARDEPDLVIGLPRRIGLGYSLGGPDSPMGPRSSAFGHGGYGGSLGFADPEQRFAFALTKNRLCLSEPGRSTADLVVRETRAALGIPEPA